MNQISSTKAILISITLFTAFGFTQDIARRHDKDDTEYLTLGAKYPAVCIVGKKGGDGTLIADQWVITAGHVAKGMAERSGGQIEIYFAHRDEPYLSESIFMHPNYQVVEHDIALIKLNEPVKGIAPLPLYQDNDELGKQITIVGHGYAKAGNETTWVKDGKKRAATNIIDRINENHIQFDFDKPGDPDITDLEGTAGSGDSGGPALIDKGNQSYIAGISSAGEPGSMGPATYGAREYYTRVSTHISWINDVLDSKVSPTNQMPVSNDEESVVIREVEGLPPGFFKDLGLFLSARGGKIDINGKIDELVPAAIKDIKFNPPSYLLSINGNSINSINTLTEQIDAINRGDSYEIEFEIQGEKKRFTLTK